MKKVGITGHTSGIGKACYDEFQKQNFDVFGYSRGNGYPLESSLEKIANSVIEFDIFINNAYDEYHQVTLLYKLYDRWKDQEKIIFNISSIASDGNRFMCHPYSVHKAALDKACQQLQNVRESKLKIVNLRPGWVDTPMIKNKNIEAKKLEPMDITNIIFWIMNQPPHVYIKEISLIPTDRDK